MRKRTPKLEWQVVENDAEWARQQALLTPVATPRTGYRLYRQMYATNLFALLLLLVMVGAWWRWTPQARLRQEQVAAPLLPQPALATVAAAPAELVASVAYQQSALEQLHQVESATGGLSPMDQSVDPTSALDIALEHVAIRVDQAVVGIVLANDHGTPLYRQTRFYRRTTPLTWQQTRPDATLWGAEERLATPYFLYRFRQQDGAVVRSVAPTIDALYTTLWGHLGLPIRLMPDKLVVHVTLEQLPGQAPLLFDTRRSIRVPSPARYLAPVALSDADLLAQSIALPLLAHGLAEAREQYQIGPAWQPLVDGLYLWQVWELALPLASWRETLVKWQYRDLPATRPEEALPLPLHYQELCAAHKLWLRSPQQIHIPLVCAGRHREDGQWRAWRAAAPLTHLAQLAVPSPLMGGEGVSSVIGPSFFTNHPGQTVALATLVEYAVETYGLASLPALVAGLGDADSWDTLLPAVFGVSTAEFETGWQTYLTDQYDLYDSPTPFRSGRASQR